VTQPNSLYQIFEEASRPGPGLETLKEEVGYRHLVALADMYTEWTLDERLSPEQKAQCLGRAKAVRSVAEDVGPDWNPPRPEDLSVLAIAALAASGECPPPRKPVTTVETVKRPPRSELILRLEQRLKNPHLSDAARNDCEVSLRRLKKLDAWDAARAKKG